MKVMYVEAKTRESPTINTKELAKLPKKLLLVYSIQYMPLAKEIKKYLESTKHTLSGFKQVLGCTKLVSKDPILLIGSGKFHAINLAIQNNVPIYIYNNQGITKMGQKDVQKIKARKQAALIKFLASDKIGILVSTKPGQNRIKDAKALKKKLESKGKKAYLLTSNNLNLAELENFSLQSWVNTACPGLAYDAPGIVNIDDLSSVKY